MEIVLSVGFCPEAAKLTKGDLLIFDEGDHLLLRDLVDLPKNCYGIIAMTATDVSSYEGLEKRRLDQLHFVLNDSKIPSTFDANVSLPAVSEQEFLEMGKNRRARIIWCQGEDMLRFESLAKEWGLRVRVNHKLIDDLRKLRSNDCLIITKLKYMRGVDYKS